MNFINKKGASMEEMFEDVKGRFPQYTITLKRNRFLGFSYIEVKKSSLIGSWIRMKNNKVSTVGCIPSLFVRIMFGGLILIAFINGKLKRLGNEVGGYLYAKYA